MKKLFLTLLFVSLAVNCWGAEHWVFIRTYDKPELSINDVSGRSKAGDIVDICSVESHPILSEEEKQEWAVKKVSGLTDEQIQQLKEPQYDKGKVVAYRKNSLDIKVFGLETPGEYSSAIPATLILSNTDSKSAIDILGYKISAVRYALLKPFLPRSILAAETVSTINKTGETYNTLTLWEDAKDGNITAGNDEVAEVYDDDGVLDNKAVISGWTCDADSRIIIRNASGEVPVISNATTSGATISFTGTNSYFAILHGLTIQPNTTADSSGITISAAAAGSTFWIRNCKVDGQEDANTYGIYCSDVDATVYLYNNWVWGCQRADFGGVRFTTFTAAYFYCNTVYNCAKGFVAPSSGTDIVMKNNCSFGNGDVNNDDYLNTAQMTGNNNLSSDATGDDFGTDGIANATIDATNDVVSLTAGSEDFHIKGTSSNFYNTGVDVYSDASLAVTSDIDGDTLTVRNDIGADEFVAAGGAAAANANPVEFGRGFGRGFSRGMR
jgi:hypothetical protein